MCSRLPGAPEPQTPLQQASKVHATGAPLIWVPVGAAVGLKPHAFLTKNCHQKRTKKIMKTDQSLKPKMTQKKYPNLVQKMNLKMGEKNMPKIERKNESKIDRKNR